MSDATVTCVGRCPGCLRMKKLTNMACADCGGTFGQHFGRIASRIRSEPRLKGMCYDALKSDALRAKFVEMFGPLEATG